jgi:hypothetical protein
MLTLDGTPVEPGMEIPVSSIIDGELTYKPQRDQSGDDYDSFIFQVSDGTQYSAGSYTMTIDVKSTNTPPTSSDNTVATTEDRTYVFQVADFAFSDADADAGGDDRLRAIRITGFETAGELRLNGVDVDPTNNEITKRQIRRGELTFDPFPDEYDSINYDSFTFRVSDGIDFSVEEYTMTITVDPVNDAPVRNEQGVFHLTTLRSAMSKASSILIPQTKTPYQLPPLLGTSWPIDSRTRIGTLWA